MAKSQIGAIIGVEGALEYKRQLNDCVVATKNLASATKLVEASFKGQTKTVSDLARHKLALKGQIIGVVDKLRLQRDTLAKLTEAYKKGDENAIKYKNEMIDLATATNKTETELYELEQALNELNQQNGLTLFVDAWKNASSKTGEAMKEIGTAFSKYVSLPIAALGTLSVKNFASVESAFTGVKKTVNGSKEELEDLYDVLKLIPLRTASTTEEVMGVAEAAGQLGVELKDIPKFAENIIMLADSTNIAADTGAVSIAQFMNIVGDETDTVDKFGSALVELGNNTATDEASILALATRMASAGHLINLTTPEILGLSAAMSAVGVTAEAGGTAMSTTIQLITKAVASGSDDVEKFGKVTGMTAEEFSNLWRTKPVDALQQLLIGMGNLEGGGEELIMFMDELGWSGIRQSDLIRRLTSDYDGVTDAVDMANRAYQDNTALEDEASKRYKDLNSKVSQAKEAFKIFSSEVGEDLANKIKPVIEDIRDAFAKMAEKWDGLSEPAKNFIFGIAGALAAIGPGLVIFGNLLIFAAKLKAAFSVFGGVMGTLKAVMSGVLVPMIAVGVIAAVIYAAIKNWDKIKEIASNVWGKVTEILDNVNQYIENLLLSVSNFIDSTIEFINQLWEFLSQKLAEDWQQIVDFFTNVLESANQFLENVLLSVAEFFTNLGAKLQEDWASILEWLHGIAESIMTGFLSFFEWLIGQLILFFLVKLPEFLGKAIQFIAETGQAIWDGITNTVSNIWQTIQEIVQNVTEIFTNLVSSALSWGADLVSNLVSGIRSGIGAIAGAIGEIATTIWEHLHFSEPEKGKLKDLHTWMPDMMKELADGIDANVYLVDDALSNVVDRMSNRLSGNNNVTMNNTFTINNGNVDERTVLRWADLMTDRVNENLGRMYG